ncbi:cyclin-B2-4-like isoform X5 [Juglans microcarpa x Juglans regia]|nr:cyclin-B2-4-like isoform X5 [Juglans microcarpa x Juglans regia]
MGGSKENYPCLIRPSSFQGPRMGDAKFVQEMGHNHRLVLGDIDQNVVGVTLNPLVVNEAEFKGKLAAQMVQQCPGGLCEAKKHTSLAPNPCSLNDTCEDASDGGVPMFVKHTEDMLDEIDRMRSKWKMRRTQLLMSIAAI